MELLQLRYFLALADSEHLTRTALALRISPPSLSMTIKKLEEELGAPLFDRTHNQIRLNENGHRFRGFALQALRLLDTGAALARGGIIPPITVGLTSVPVWADLLHAFEREHPALRIDMQTFSIRQLTDASKAFPYSFYLGIMEDIDPRRFSYVQVLESEKPVALLPAGHPLANRSSLRLEELRTETFISVLPENASAHHYMLSLCRAAGFEPSGLLYGDYLTRVKLLSQGRGVAVTTWLGAAVNSIPSEKIASVPLSSPLLTRTQAVCWEKDRLLSPEEQMFLEFASSYFFLHPPAGFARPPAAR